MGYSHGENHNLFNHGTYSVWIGIKKRCYNVKCVSFKNYGSRGIIMCDEWKNSFLSFYNFCISHGWKDGLHIDRIDVNGNYEPKNCQFITQAENNGIGKHRKQTNNSSGYIGVNWHKRDLKWQARITINKKRIVLGMFLLKEDALQSRIEAEVKYFGKQLTNL
jgi:hypothetical protein